MLYVDRNIAKIFKSYLKYAINTAIFGLSNMLFLHRHRWELHGASPNLGFTPKSTSHMTLFSVENSKSELSSHTQLTPYGNRRMGYGTPYRMSGLGIYLVAVSHVLYLNTYNS